MKNSLNSTVKKEANPFKGVWDKYIHGKITLQELHSEVRGRMLNRVSHCRYQEMPPVPAKKTKKNMQGWAEACLQRSLENHANRHHLIVLLKDLQNGNLASLPGKKEEIQELLAEYPHPSPRS